MGVSIGKYHITLEADGSRFTTAMGRAGGSVRGLTNIAERAGAYVNRLTGRIASLASVAGGLSAIGSIGLGVRLAADAEQSRVALTVLTGSAEKAAQVFDRVNAFAASTPFQSDELLSSARQLIAFGSSADGVSEELRVLGNLAAGTGSRVGDLAEILGKAQVQNQIYGEDLNQLAGRGIPVLQELADQFGVPAAAVKKMASEGRLEFADLRRAMFALASDGGKFAGLAEAQSRTLAGAWSTLADNAKNALRLATEAALAEVDLNAAIARGTELVREYGGQLATGVRDVVRWAAEHEKLIVTGAKIAAGIVVVNRLLPIARGGIYTTAAAWRAYAAAVGIAAAADAARSAGRGSALAATALPLRSTSAGAAVAGAARQARAYAAAGAAHAAAFGSSYLGRVRVARAATQSLTAASVAQAAQAAIVAARVRAGDAAWMASTSTMLGARRASAALSAGKDRLADAAFAASTRAGVMAASTRRAATSAAAAAVNANTYRNGLVALRGGLVAATAATLRFVAANALAAASAGRSAAAAVFSGRAFSGLAASTALYRLRSAGALAMAGRFAPALTALGVGGKIAGGGMLAGAASAGIFAAAIAAVVAGGYNLLNTVHRMNHEGESFGRAWTNSSFEMTRSFDGFLDGTAGRFLRWLGVTQSKMSVVVGIANTLSSVGIMGDIDVSQLDAQDAQEELGRLNRARIEAINAAGIAGEFGNARRGISLELSVDAVDLDLDKVQEAIDVVQQELATAARLAETGDAFAADNAKIVIETNKARLKALEGVAEAARTAQAEVAEQQLMERSAEREAADADLRRQASIVETIDKLREQAAAAAEIDPVIFDLKQLGAANGELAEAERLLNRIAANKAGDRLAEQVSRLRRELEGVGRTDAENRLAELAEAEVGRVAGGFGLGSIEGLAELARGRDRLAEIRGLMEQIDAKKRIDVEVNVRDGGFEEVRGLLGDLHGRIESLYRDPIDLKVDVLATKLPDLLGPMKQAMLDGYRGQLEHESDLEQIQPFARVEKSAADKLADAAAAAERVIAQAQVEGNVEKEAHGRGALERIEAEARRELAEREAPDERGGKRLEAGGQDFAEIVARREAVARGGATQPRSNEERQLSETVKLRDLMRRLVSNTDPKNAPRPTRTIGIP